MSANFANLPLLILCGVFLRQITIDDAHATQYHYLECDSGQEDQQDADERYQSEYEREDVVSDDQHEVDSEDGPLVTVRRLVATYQRFAGSNSLVKHQVDSQAPANGDDDARHNHKEESRYQRHKHETNQREILAHVLTILAVEDEQGRDDFAFAQFDNKGEMTLPLLSSIGIV